VAKIWGRRNGGCSERSAADIMFAPVGARVEHLATMCRERLVPTGSDCWLIGCRRNGSHFASRSPP
jgi:hypothetical protein